MVYIRSVEEVLSTLWCGGSLTLVFWTYFLCLWLLDKWGLIWVQTIIRNKVLSNGYFIIQLSHLWGCCSILIFHFSLFDENSRTLDLLLNVDHFGWLVKLLTKHLNNGLFNLLVSLLFLSERNLSLRFKGNLLWGNFDLRFFRCSN